MFKQPGSPQFNRKDFAGYNPCSNLEELVKGSNWVLHPEGNGLLVQDDVEVLDAVASFADTEQKGLLGASFFQEGLHA